MRALARVARPARGSLPLCHVAFGLQTAKVVGGSSRRAIFTRAVPGTGGLGTESGSKTFAEASAIQQEVKKELEHIIRGFDRGGTAGANGASSASAGVQQLKAKLRNAVSVMQEGLVERDTEVRLLLLAAMAGEHILLIGPPGTAKSEVGRRLSRLVDGQYFERLLTRFSVPEELFGPLSMRALEEDQYVRQTTGYLPEAEVAFIDEIFKANSAILNTLLTLINERLFDNGQMRQRVPLLSVVGASNELPESEELDALYDRFLVRRQVAQVSASGVAQMLQYYSSEEAVAGMDASASGNGAGSSWSGGAALPAAMRLTRDEIRACKAEALKRVRIPQHVIQLVTDLRSYLQEKVEPPVYVSDRRLVKSVQMLQVAAFCNGRAEVSEYDLLLLEHVLWQRPEQAIRINEWVMSQLSVDDGIKQVKYLLTGLFSRACRSLGKAETVHDLLEEIQKMRSLLLDKYSQVMGSIGADARSGGSGGVLSDNLWLGADDAEAVTTALKPKLDKTRIAVEGVLYEVLKLEAALKRDANPILLANLMPDLWADFIRNSDEEQVKPFGVRPMKP